MTSEEPGFLSLLKSSDVSAWQAWYNRYAPALYGCILRLVPQRFAPDILDKSLSIIIRRIYLYDPATGTLFSWMLRIALHQCQEQAFISNAAIRSGLVSLKQA